MAMEPNALILVVDDDPELRNLIASFLGGHGYRLQVAENATQMDLAIARERPDLVVLDVMMPGEDGLSAARRLAAEKGPPVIILSALGGDTDRIIGLEVGADDYLAKPCNPRELLARVRAVLRRSSSSEPAEPGDARPYLFAGWRFDVTRRDLRDPTGIFINLSDGEFALLRAFVDHPQRILTRDQLLDLVHGGRTEVYDRAIDTQISRLRRKLNDRASMEMIRTVRNEGYMLVPKVGRP
ncbi:response regulator [Luteibacter aegosomaticola]|nr:response regulator [Luteibacter aegosomaticola]UPG90807.1 response regulator [Luteibacter aegosomaticola]